MPFLEPWSPFAETSVPFVESLVRFTESSIPFMESSVAIYGVISASFWRQTAIRTDVCPSLQPLGLPHLVCFLAQVPDPTRPR